MSIRSEDIPQSLAKAIETDEMDWDAYATQYDELCELNPAYHENINMLTDYLASWGGLSTGSTICDLGAGTGNYIVELNKHYPDAGYWHVDFDLRMNDLAAAKYARAGLKNVSIVHNEIHDVRFEPNSFDLIICINALYAFTPHEQVLRRARSWLKPDGRLFLIDFGRKQSTIDWTVYIFREAMKSHRVGRYARALVESREVLKQNRRATKGQQSGRYWLHSTEQFGAALSKIGFQVHELAGCYRGYADMAICSK